MQPSTEGGALRGINRLSSDRTAELRDGLHSSGGEETEDPALMSSDMQACSQRQPQVDRKVGWTRGDSGQSAQACASHISTSHKDAPLPFQHHQSAHEAQLTLTSTSEGEDK